jgi:glutamate dehydrogenase
VACWDQKDQASYCYRNKSGIDVDALAGITDCFGSIGKDRAGELGLEVLPGEAWIEQDVEILVPAAVENQIASNVNKISRSVRIIAEGADGSTTPEADEVLSERGIFVIPDLLANAAGVICSYFEQVQSNMNYYWQRDEVLGKLDVMITSAFENVRQVAQRENIHMRDAAYYIAVARVAKACTDRGWL